LPEENAVAAQPVAVVSSVVQKPVAMGIKVEVSQKIDYAIAFGNCKKSKKSAMSDPNQLSLFDLIAS